MEGTGAHEPQAVGGGAAMASSPSAAVGAGRGAAHVLLPVGRHVYGAWSRRAGGASLGVDLTPDGACSIDCVYCQVPRQGLARGRPTVDIEALRFELERALSLPPDTGWADLALAGSGEPTFAVNVGLALAAIAAILDRAGFDRPRRLYTNGLHLAQSDVEAAVIQWLDCPYGQVWAKLDALDDGALERIWQVRIPARAHLARLWTFAARHPVSLQSTLVSAPDLPSIEDTARLLGAEVRRALDAGARILAMHLLSPSRKPGNPAVAGGIQPAAVAQLAVAAEILRAIVPIPIATYA